MAESSLTEHSETSKCTQTCTGSFIESAAAVPPDPPTPMRSSLVKDRERFSIFIKILFKSLDRVAEEDVNSGQLRHRARQVVCDCTRKNREGDPDYIPLIEAIEIRLQDVVGPVHWARANRCLQQFMQRSRSRYPPAAKFASV